MTRALLFALALAGCTREGTGVELLIEAGGLTLDSLQIRATYDSHDVTQTVSVVATSSLDVIAQLPDESTTVTFEVIASDGGVQVGHGMTSQPIAVTPHHLSQAMISLVPGTTDGFSPPSDLAGDLAGVLWTHQQGALPPSTGAIRGIWASSGTDVYAVGTNTGGANTFHSSDHGATWSPQRAMGLAVDLNAVSGTSSSDVYLVGDNGTILHGSGTTWATQTCPAGSVRLLSIWAISAGDIYIAGGSNSIMHSAGGGSWILQTPVDATVELRGVWGVAGNIWAIGSGGKILKSTGTATWTPETSGTPNELRAIFGTSATDVWVVGDSVVLHSDGGGTWTPAADGVPTDVSLRAIGGRPSGPVWAVGNAWTIVRRDPSAWVVEPTGLTVDDQAGDTLQAIFAPSASEVFAGGAGQTILHRP
jgi:hypothetical protein